MARPARRHRWAAITALTAFLGLPAAGAAAAQAVKPGATANRAQIDVTLAGDAPPGIHLLRVANAKGVSNAAAVGVDGLPQLPLAAQLSRLPAALYGTLAGSASVQTSFAGKK